MNNSKNEEYLGSPALAIETLSKNSGKYIFFDIDKDALNNIKKYSIKNQISNKVIIKNEESILGISELLEKLDNNDFIHFDPYFIFDKNEENQSFLDLFLKASERNIKCMFWYGFNTLKQKEVIKDTIKGKIKKSNLLNKKIKSVEIILKAIEDLQNNYNPGIMGCGVVISNLSTKSYNEIDILSDELVKIYKDVKLKNDISGELVKDTIKF